MIQQVTTHEDKRRRLIEYNNGISMKRCKVIKVKDTKCVLGKHYHLKNDSIFYMLSGKAIYYTYPVDPTTHKQSGARDRGWLFEEEAMFVPAGVAHTFEVFPNSILLECCSETYDKEDEIPVLD